MACRLLYNLSTRNDGNDRITHVSSRAIFVSVCVSLPLCLSVCCLSAVCGVPLSILAPQGGSDLWLREFEVSSGACLRTFKGHHGPVR